ncbi:MAG: hypothetical protein ABR985_22810 [Methanotrichaceae archaeon]|jgi:hypothetical protein
MKQQVWHDQEGNEISTPLGPDGNPTHSKIKDINDANRPAKPRPPGGKKK